MKFSSTKHEEKKQKILSATFRCISRRGIDGVSLRSIAKEAKINPALLHYYFRDKESLLSEFIQYLFEQRFIVEVERQIRPAESPEKKLETLFQLARNFVEKQKQLFVVFIDVWSFCLRHPSLQKAYARINKRMAEFIDKILDEGISKDVFYPVPKEVLSYHFVAAVVGIGVIWHMNNQSINLDDQFDIVTQNLRQVVHRSQL